MSESLGDMDQPLRVVYQKGHHARLRAESPSHLRVTAGDMPHTTADDVFRLNMFRAASSTVFGGIFFKIARPSSRLRLARRWSK